MRPFRGKWQPFATKVMTNRMLSFVPVLLCVNLLSCELSCVLCFNICLHLTFRGRSIINHDLYDIAIEDMHNSLYPKNRYNFFLKTTVSSYPGRTQNYLNIRRYLRSQDAGNCHNRKGRCIEDIGKNHLSGCCRLSLAKLGITEPMRLSCLLCITSILRQSL